MGVEPTRAIAHNDLNVARLPFRHFRIGHWRLFNRTNPPFICQQYF